MDIKFKNHMCFLFLEEELYDIVVSNKLFDKKKNQFVGNDKELDFLCKVVPGFEDKINDYVCDFIKIFLKQEN